MRKQPTRAVLGIPVTGPVLGVFFWQLGGFDYGWTKNSRVLTRCGDGGIPEVIARPPCRKAAVAYSIGLEDGLGNQKWGQQSLEVRKG